MRPKHGIRTAANPYLTARTASLQLFAGIEHRMESVRKWKGIEFINDSKSTDIESTYYSLELVEAPITWIIGATDIKTDYSHVLKFVKYKVINLIVVGINNSTDIRKKYSNLVDCYMNLNSVDDAVLAASTLAKSGSVVLFSPACSSFENYEDYLERGDHFKKIVNELN